VSGGRLPQGWGCGFLHLDRVVEPPSASPGGERVLFAGCSAKRVEACRGEWASAKRMGVPGPAVQGMPPLPVGGAMLRPDTRVAAGGENIRFHSRPSGWSGLCVPSRALFRGAAVEGKETVAGIGVAVESGERAEPSMGGKRETTCDRDVGAFFWREGLLRIR